jgi:hypothetical protein
VRSYTREQEERHFRSESIAESSNWRDRKTLKEIGEELGYTHNCRGCGKKSDTPWCGCDAGAPERDDEPPENDEHWDVGKRKTSPE